MRARAQRRDEKKERYWQEKIRNGARSGLSIREFCRREGLKESQFYSWRRELWRREQEKAGNRKRKVPNNGTSVNSSFALVSMDEDSRGLNEAGIELVLESGRRLRIGKGVDAETLVNVVTALEQKRC
jgi:transposase-like protein